MSVWKKNLMALGILVTVCTGIYLNWVYSGKTMPSDLVDTINTDAIIAVDDNDTTELNSQAENTVSDYFAAVRLSRQQARDNAVNLLQEAMAYSDEETDGNSSDKLDTIIQTSLSEAQIESLVIAKGYRDCVAYMSDEGISVAVAAPEGGLQQTDVAVIADIVMTQSSWNLEDIRVIEVQ